MDEGKLAQCGVDIVPPQALDSFIIVAKFAVGCDSIPVSELSVSVMEEARTVATYQGMPHTNVLDEWEPLPDLRSQSFQSSRKVLVGLEAGPGSTGVVLAVTLKIMTLEKTLGTWGGYSPKFANCRRL